MPYTNTNESKQVCKSYLTELCGNVMIMYQLHSLPWTVIRRLKMTAQTKFALDNHNFKTEWVSNPEVHSERSAYHLTKVHHLWPHCFGTVIKQLQSSDKLLMKQSYNLTIQHHLLLSSLNFQGLWDLPCRVQIPAYILSNYQYTLHN
jgi:hypothetical protein